MVSEKIKKIRMLAMDVDGTLTDGSIYISETGEVMKKFNVKDGLGISLLRQAGIMPAIITGRSSGILLERARELKIDLVIQGITAKGEALMKLAQENRLELNEIAFIGDDLNDMPALKLAGLSICPYDAVEIVKCTCDIILHQTGGQGAVRETADLILKTQGLYDKTITELYKFEQ